MYFYTQKIYKAILIIELHKALALEQSDWATLNFNYYLFYIIQLCVENIYISLFTHAFKGTIYKGYLPRI